MRLFFIQYLPVFFLALVSTISVADEACDPVPENDTTLNEAQQLVADTEWKRAVDQDNAADIRRLLHKVDVDITNDKGKTALMAAVKVGDHCLLQELLQRGLKISDRGYTGGTSLMYAVLGNQSEMIEQVLSYKPELNAQSTNGWTAVMIAAAKGFDSAISALHEAGADVNLADVYGWTPLMRAIDNRHGAVVEYLLSLPDIDIAQVNENGSSALHVAAQASDSPAVTRLLQRGANTEATDKNGYAPAEVATLNGHDSLAEQISRSVE